MGQIITTDTKVRNVRELIQRQMPGLQQAVPRGIDPQRFARVTLSVVRNTPKLLDCDPLTLIACMMQSAALGLELDPALKLAYLVPYGRVCQFLPGYLGLVELARRSREVRDVQPRAVHERDVFDYEYGLNEHLTHRPFRGPEPGTLVAVYAIAHMRDVSESIAGKRFDVMERWEVEDRRQRSAIKSSGAWVSDYEAMAKKSVIRRLCGYLPKSVQLARAISLDEDADRGTEQQFDDVVMDLLPSAPADAPAPATLETLTAQLAASAAPPSSTPGIEATDASPAAATPPSPGPSAAETSRGQARAAQAARHEPRRERDPGEEG